MRRRWARRCLTYTSAALFVLSTALWVRSQIQPDYLGYQRSGRQDRRVWVVGYDHGVIYWSLFDIRFNERSDFNEYDRHSGTTDGWSSYVSSPFGWSPAPSVLRDVGLLMESGSRNEGFATWSIRHAMFPVWLLILLSGIGPAWSWARYYRRPRPGLCARCGYDLRATPQRCPECGAVAAQTTHTSR
jgi:hypothetical protein